MWIPILGLSALQQRRIGRVGSESADIVVLAGDIHVGVHGIEWARRRFPLTPVVYVPGNHEYYGGSLQAVREELYARGKCLTAAQNGMSDFHVIRYENRTFQPADTRSINLERVHWLRTMHCSVY